MLQEWKNLRRCFGEQVALLWQLKMFAGVQWAQGSGDGGQTPENHRESHPWPLSGAINPGEWVHRGELVPQGGHPTGVRVGSEDSSGVGGGETSFHSEHFYLLDCSEPSSSRTFGLGNWAEILTVSQHVSDSPRVPGLESVSCLSSQFILTAPV